MSPLTSSILLFGLDSTLNRTRVLILQTRGHNIVMAGEVRDIKLIPPTNGIGFNTESALRRFSAESSNTSSDFA